MDDPARHTHAYRGTRALSLGAAAVSIGVHAMLLGLAFKVAEPTITSRVVVGRAQANVPERAVKKSVKRADRPDSVRPTSLSIRRA